MVVMIRLTDFSYKLVLFFLLPWLAAAIATAGTASMARASEQSTPGATVATAQAGDKFAGTYKIENWAQLEKQGLYHFFYLHRSGRFLLAGHWADNESSRIAGRWRVEGERLVLRGQAHVNTNQGNWQVPFERVFRIDVGAGVYTLRPRLDKNRYGLLGWPNPFIFYRPQLVPNLPGAKLPTDEQVLLALIDRLRVGT